MSAVFDYEISPWSPDALCHGCRGPHAAVSHAGFWYCLECSDLALERIVALELAPELTRGLAPLFNGRRW